MVEDSIVKQTRKIREQIALEHKYDVYKLGRYFMRKQQAGQRVFITIPSQKFTKNDRAK
ncbi:hypothetical protein VU00_13052 [Candidatus Electrothrix marina]|uniref:Uncharacterized protein n=1 Tax=Candidatus Electrothrix marina TaxID=1859130 RepID=A0A3S3QMT7_9BACT|nr:hypothetical protein VU00_13052 [Candidatus Electrothrix marina]